MEKVQVIIQHRFWVKASFTFKIIFLNRANGLNEVPADNLQVLVEAKISWNRIL